MTIKNLQWSSSELERLLHLDENAFNTTLYKLSLHAAAGNQEALDSVANGVSIMGSDQFQGKTRLLYSTGNSALRVINTTMEWDVSRIDLIAPALSAGFVQISDLALDRMEHAWRQNGEWSVEAISADGPIARLMMHACYQCRDENALRHLFERIGDTAKVLVKTRLDTGLYKTDYRDSIESSYREAEATVLGHIMRANNAPALRALMSGMPAQFSVGMNDVALHWFQRHSKQTTEVSVLKAAAIYGSLELVDELLGGSKAAGFQIGSNQMIEALSAHLTHFGWVKSKGELDYPAGVIERMLDEGVSDVLLDIDNLRCRLVMPPKTPEQEGIYKLCKACETLADDALDSLQPLVIERCASLYGKAKHQYVSDKVRLSHPAITMLAAATSITDPKQSSARFASALQALPEDILKINAWLDDETALLKAAKNGHINLAQVLVQHGADPLLKNDRGWLASSYFKGNLKYQWDTFLRADKAQKTVATVIKNVPDVRPL